MRVIAIEEHFNTPELLEPSGRTFGPRILERLYDLGEARIADMDAAGIDLAVLSPNAPAVQMLAAGEAVELSRRTNDYLAGVVAKRPGRFAGFATVPTPDPQAAVAELERAVRELGMVGAIVHGQTSGRFLDDASLWPLLECAEALAVPIYLHPAPPPDAVFEAYYSGLGPGIGDALAMGAWGWHVETGMHALRLVVSGAFDALPRLQVVLGHMGENLPFSLARADSVLNRVVDLEHPVAHYFHENFHVTTSTYFSVPPLQCALAVFGADRIMFSVDYPFSENAAGTAFLESAPLSPFDREKLAHLNAERLLGL